MKHLKCDIFNEFLPGFRSFKLYYVPSVLEKHELEFHYVINFANICFAEYYGSCFLLSESKKLGSRSDDPRLQGL